MICDYGVSFVIINIVVFETAIVFHMQNKVFISLVY